MHAPWEDNPSTFWHACTHTQTQKTILSFFSLNMDKVRELHDGTLSSLFLYYSRPDKKLVCWGFFYHYVKILWQYLDTKFKTPVLTFDLCCNMLHGRTFPVFLHPSTSWTRLVEGFGYNAWCSLDKMHEIFSVKCMVYLLVVDGSHGCGLLLLKKIWMWAHPSCLRLSKQFMRGQGSAYTSTVNQSSQTSICPLQDISKRMTV